MPEALVKLLVEGAARVATTGNGLPLETFTALASHTLDHLVCYQPERLRVGPRNRLREQDVDYLARMFQSVFANLQDYQGEIR